MNNNAIEPTNGGSIKGLDFQVDKREKIIKASPTFIIEVYKDMQEAERKLIGEDYIVIPLLGKEEKDKGIE